MEDYFDIGDWKNEPFDAKYKKYKSYWDWGIGGGELDDPDGENYERLFLPPEVPVPGLHEAGISPPSHTVKDLEFFLSLIEDTTDVAFDVIGTSIFKYTIVWYGKEFDRRPEIVVFPSEGKYTICENLEKRVNKRVYDKREDAGAYILKWILGHIC